MKRRTFQGEKRERETRGSRTEIGVLCLRIRRKVKVMDAEWMREGVAEEMEEKEEEYMIPPRIIVHSCPTLSSMRNYLPW